MDPFNVDEQHRVIDLNSAKAKRAAQVLAKEYRGSVSYQPIESTLLLHNGHEQGITFKEVVRRFKKVHSFSDRTIDRLLQK